MKKLIFALVFAALLSVLLVFNAGAEELPYEKPVGTVYMQYGTPKIDGSIGESEGWGKSVSLTDKNLIPVVSQTVTTYPSGNVRFAYDENYLYFAADVTDDDYIYCTKYFVDDYVRCGYPMPKSNFAFDGDVVALAFDWDNIIASELGYLTDRPSFFCFGLFEDGHIGGYHTVLAEKDLTDIIKGSGKRTANGWCFEVAVPWNEIDVDFDANTYSNCHFDYKEMTKSGTVNKACVYFADRYDDPETGDVQLDNVYATYTEFSHVGILTANLDLFYYGMFGIDLVPTKNGGADCPKIDVPTTLDWQDPFTDLDKKAWYYNAVANACDKGWFAGMTKTTFDPSGKLTRAMFVKVLASLARYDGTTATGTMYKDVPANKWYSASVEWATNNNIASGTGGGYFNPDLYLTREQAAQFLYKFAQFKKYRTDSVKSGVIDSYPDRKDVSGWAVTSLEWAVDNGLISGNKKGNAVYLDPKGTATRAQCAQIVKAFDSKTFTHFAKDGELAKLSICGVDISEYVIIYGGEKQDQKSAEMLTNYIELTTGVFVDAYRDTAKEETENEILIGKTNREDSLPKIDRTNVGPEEFLFRTFENESKMLISGGEKNGTYYGTCWFIEEYLGWIFGDGECEERYYNETINIEGGITETHGSMIKQLSWCDFDLDGDFEKKIRLCGDTVQSDDAVQCGIAYLFAGLNYSKFETTNMNPNPCYSDPENIEFITNMMLKRMEQEQDRYVFSMGCYDTDIYCTCDRCLEIYREEGSRSGTYIRLVNHVASVTKQKYPDNKLMLVAYGCTKDAPKTAADKNVIVRFVNISSCFHHPINDPDCPHNYPLYKSLLEWSEKCDTLWVGDHGTTFRLALSPVMNFNFFYENTRFYNSLGVSGFIYWSVNGNEEFNPTRAYLIAHTFWDPEMTRDEYQILLESNFEARYGAAWRNMVEYTDILTRAQDPVHFCSHPNAEAIVSRPLFDSRVDRFDELWAEMYDVVEEGTPQHNQLDTTFVSYLFLRQTIEWEKEYQNGTEAQKAEYYARNELLYDLFDKYPLHWHESFKKPGNADFTKKPSSWS